jgi:hypothetical protein
MTRFNIDTCAMLVEVNVRQWTARKLDKTTTDEVLVNKSAGSKGAARVNKNLLAGRPELETINQCVGAIRTYLYDVTLPWSDSGLRLLTTAKFMEFNQRMQEFEDKFNALVDDFVTTYPTLITAQAMALGDMFNRNEYPTPDDIKHRFDFRVNYMPVPTSGDFRVDVGNDAQEELRKKLASLADERIENAMSDIKTRLKDHLKRMSDRLTVDYTGRKAQPRMFHASLLDTAQELCSLAKDLNITEDKELEDARIALYQAINGLEVDDLRKDLDTRQAVKKDVDSILDKFNF